MNEENTQELAQAAAELTAEPTPELVATPEPTPEVATEVTAEATAEATFETTSDPAAMSSLPPEVTSALLGAAKVGLEFGVEALADADAKIEKLNAALENCRLLAAKRPKEEWARHILRFCESAGVTGSPLRG
jgi:Xaa-Pro aminopeptidase